MNWEWNTKSTQASFTNTKLSLLIMTEQSLVAIHIIPAKTLQFLQILHANLMKLIHTPLPVGIRKSLFVAETWYTQLHTAEPTSNTRLPSMTKTEPSSQLKHTIMAIKSLLQRTQQRQATRPTTIHSLDGTASSEHAQETLPSTHHTTRHTSNTQ